MYAASLKGDIESLSLAVIILSISSWPSCRIDNATAGSGGPLLVYVEGHLMLQGVDLGSG